LPILEQIRPLILIYQLEKGLKIWILHLEVHILIHFLNHRHFLAHQCFDLLLRYHLARASQGLDEVSWLLCADVFQAVKDVAKYLLVGLFLRELLFGKAGRYLTSIIHFNIRQASQRQAKVKMQRCHHSHSTHDSRDWMGRVGLVVRFRISHLGQLLLSWDLLLLLVV
jgi:hypothetical protein